MIYKTIYRKLRSSNTNPTQNRRLNSIAMDFQTKIVNTDQTNKIEVTF